MIAKDVNVLPLQGLGLFVHRQLHYKHFRVTLTCDSARWNGR
jgi:hypothetical protein